jgi:hypothetical protein
MAIDGDNFTIVGLRADGAGQLWTLLYRDVVQARRRPALATVTRHIRALSRFD